MNYEIKEAPIIETMYPRFGRVIYPVSGVEGKVCVQLRAGGSWFNFSREPAGTVESSYADIVPFPPGTQITFTQE